MNALRQLLRLAVSDLQLTPGNSFIKAVATFSPRDVIQEFASVAEFLRKSFAEFCLAAGT